MSVSGPEAVTTGMFGQSPLEQTTKDDKQMFLELMVAQLRYQDPLNPADSGEFLSQTAQFNSLEQMTKVAEQTAALVATNLAFGATGMVGRDVTYFLEDGTTAAGRVDGVTFSSEGPLLDIGGKTVPLALIQSVGTGLTPPPATPDSTPNQA